MSLIDLEVDAKTDRDRLLKLSDYTQIPDNPLSFSQEWIDYRTALRNIEQQDGFPETIVWPETPALSADQLLLLVVKSEADRRIKSKYPDHIPPGRYELLTPDEKTALDAEADRIAKASTTLIDDIKRGERIDPRRDEFWEKAEDSKNGE